MLHRHCCDDEGPDWGNKDSRTACAAVPKSASVREMMARVMTANEMPKDCSAVCRKCSCERNDDMSDDCL